MNYRRLYVASYGHGPHECCFCGDAVKALPGGISPDQLVVHHVDGDRRNNAIGNLDACHMRCHTVHHHTGVPESSDARRKVSASLVGNKNGSGNKGRAKTAEHRARIARASVGNKSNLGRKFSSEHRRRISEGVRKARAAK